MSQRATVVILAVVAVSSITVSAQSCAIATFQDVRGRRRVDAFTDPSDDPRNVTEGACCELCEADPQCIIAIHDPTQDDRCQLLQSFDSFESDEDRSVLTPIASDATLIESLVCRREFTNITCPIDRTLSFLFVGWGRTVENTCDDDSNIDCGVAIGVPEFVSERCDGERQCSLTAQSLELGGEQFDPCNGTSKYLNLSYVCLSALTGPTPATTTTTAAAATTTTITTSTNGGTTGTTPGQTPQPTPPGAGLIGQDDTAGGAFGGLPPWVLPVIIAVGSLVILASVIACLVVRRRKGKRFLRNPDRRIHDPYSGEQALPKRRGSRSFLGSKHGPKPSTSFSSPAVGSP